MLVLIGKYSIYMEHLGVDSPNLNCCMCLSSQRRKGHWTQTCLEISVVEGGECFFVLFCCCWLLVRIVVGWLFLLVFVAVDFGKAH